MNATVVVVEGRVQPDGTLKLTQKIDLPAGPVQSNVSRTSVAGTGIKDRRSERVVFLDANVIVGPDGGINRKHGRFFVHQSGPGLRACCLGTALATMGWAASDTDGL
jgi:hypothetical protein